MATAGRILLIHRGRYDEYYEYEPLDLVLYEGNSWLCRKTALGIVPSDDSENWQKFTDVPTEDSNWVEYDNTLVLDGYTENGKVLVLNDSDAAVERNFPCLKGGLLTVQSIIQDGLKYVKQTYTARNNSAEYRRIYDYHTGTWSAWTTHITNDDIVVISAEKTVTVEGSSAKKFDFGWTRPTGYILAGSHIECNSIHLLPSYTLFNTGAFQVRNFANGEQTAKVTGRAIFIKSDKVTEQIIQEMS